MPKIPQRKLQSKVVKPIGSKPKIQVGSLKELRRLSNADECVGYKVRTKPRVMVGSQDYGLLHGKIIDVFTGEDKDGIRIVAHTIELDDVILVDVPSKNVDWIGMP